MQTHSEDARAIVRDLGLVSAEHEPIFEQLTQVCASLFHARQAAFGVQRSSGLFLKAEVGLQQRSFSHSPNFCRLIEAQRNALVVADARHDPRFAQDPWVLDQPRLRFFVGAAVRAPDGVPIGALCALDRRPRICTQAEIDAFLNLRDALEEVLRLRLAAVAESRTGALHCRHFMQRLDEETRHASRHAEPLSLLQVKIDFLQRYVHTYGQREADRVAERMAHLIGTHARRSRDVVGRLGDDRFGLLLPYTSAAQAQQIAGRLFAEVATTATPHETAPGGSVTVSIGGACLPSGSSSPRHRQQLFDGACAALQTLRLAGGNAVHLAELPANEPAAMQVPRYGQQ